MVGAGRLGPSALHNAGRNYKHKSHRSLRAMALRPYGQHSGPIIAERGCTMLFGSPLPGPWRRFRGAGKVRYRPAGDRGSQRPPGAFLGVGDGACGGSFGSVGPGGTLHRGQGLNRKTGRYEAATAEPPTPSLLNRRWLITFDHDGRERVTPIDPERFFLKMEELPDLIRDPGFMIDGKLLVEVVHACADRLANKLGCRARQVSV